MLSKQTKAFPDTSISKPNTLRAYEVHHRQSTKFTINAPSTLDRVSQAGHIRLAQTTLEKLAAFRFKTSAVDVELDQATSWNPQTDTTSLEARPFAHGQSTGNGGNNNYPVPEPDDTMSPVEHEAHEDVSHQTPHARATVGGPEDDCYDLFDETANISCSMDAQDYANTYGSVCNDMSKQNYSDILEVSSSVYRDSAIDTEMVNLSNAREPAEAPQGWDEEGLDDEDFAQLDTNDLALPEVHSVAHIVPKNASIQSPVERRNYDFDDGAADDVLVEIMVKHEKVHKNYSGHQATTSLNSSGEPSAEFENASRPSLRLQSTDDEYFMDDIDEAELANLAELADPIIIETHSPPSNWTKSDVRSRDMEVYDEKLNYSSPSIEHDDNIINRNQLRVQPSVESLAEPEDWSFLNHNSAVSENIGSLRNDTLQIALPMTPGPSGPRSANDDSHEYTHLSPFARSPFPEKVCGGSLIPGLTACTILRTCFRIGECMRAGSFCNRLNQDAIVELFCRVTFSSRENGTHKQIFQFADIFHSNPPFVSGVLANYRVSALQERESMELLTGDREEPAGMARCLGRLKAQLGGNGWILHLSNIRKSDWEEVRWTRRIVGVQEAKKIQG